MYPLLRSALFRLDAERAHHLVTDQLPLWNSFAPPRALIEARYAKRHLDEPAQVMGLTFPIASASLPGLTKMVWQQQLGLSWALALLS